MPRDSHQETVKTLQRRARGLRGLAASDIIEESPCEETARAALCESAAILEDAAEVCKGIVVKVTQDSVPA